MEKRYEILKKFNEQREYTERRIARGIESNRKSDAHISVKDRLGNPVDATIRVLQRTHEFKHGSNLFMLDGLGSAEKNLAYRNYFKSAFNMATLPFYWRDIEPERGVTRYEKASQYIYRRPPIELCMEFCENSGIEAREHGLAYEHHFPDWLCGADSETVKRELERRYREISARYAKRIPCIEVTNEHEWGNNCVTSFYHDKEFIPWCYDMAARYFPKNELVINEWGSIWSIPDKQNSRYFLLIDDALRKGIRIDAIGMQFHMFHRREDELAAAMRSYDPVNLFQTMDAYASLGKPLQITEVTIPSYSWKPADEAIQAEILANLYPIWFSHPAVEQIIYWNLVDGYAWQAEQGDMSAGENYYHGGLFRFDLTPKPAYETIQRLFNTVWHTEQTIETKAGEAYFRGFYGVYNIELEIGAQTISRELFLSKQGVKDFLITV